MNLLNKHFILPFKPHDFQVEAKDEIQILDCSLLKFKVGLGKTVTGLMAALEFSLGAADIDQIWILCPPILIDQWHAFLLKVKGIPDIGVFRGTPVQRTTMDLQESIIIASYNIFRGKKDHIRFQKLAEERRVCIIADELSLKDLQSKTYRKLKKILYRKMRLKLGDEPFHKLIALNATPLSDPEQVYNWCALCVPGVYPSKKLFLNAHMAAEDPWGKVTEWKNEDIMRRNFGIFCVDTDHEVKLPPLVKTLTPYSLTREHMNMYKSVVNAELERLPDDKIELVINAMFSALQRAVLQPQEFGLNIRSPILDYIDSYLGQASDEGVLIYTRHVSLSKMLAEYIPDCAAIYGGISKKVRDKAFADIKSGKCTRLVGNMDSIGAGLNLQELNHTLYIEFPFRWDKEEQSSGRIYRQGQQKTCFINYPMAKNTVQVQIYNKLIKNEKILSKIIKTKSDIKSFLLDST